MRTLAAAAICALALAASPARAEPSAARRTPVVLAVERTKGAVVNINAQEVVRRRAANDPFELYFGGGGLRDEVRTSLGTGFVFDSTGLVLTNYHVVAQGSRIQITMDDGSDYIAKVIGTDPGGDLAVLKIQADGPFPVAPLGVSSDLMLGEPTIAIGNPYGLNQSVSMGVVSALHRTVRAEGRSYYDFVQTDASINPGNSGGPLLNADGQVIGVTSAIYANAQGIGFAIPIDRALRVARELVKSGELQQAFWGFDAEAIDGEAAGALGAKAGALVTSVEEGSPAAKAGLHRGDTIVKIDGAPVRDADEMRFHLRDIPVGTQVTIGILRERRPLDVALAAVPLTSERAQAIFEQRTGLRLIELTPRQAGEAGYESRTPLLAIQRVERGSPAQRVGLRRGDLVRALNSAEVETLRQFRKALGQAKKSGRATLLIQRRFALQEFSFDLG
jgi:Do/DeqQ family serine protease